MMGNPHVIVVPYPAQGHVMPFLELSQRLVNQGIKVTFVNTEFNHDLVVSASSSGLRETVSMVSIPDGLEPWEDRTELGKLTDTIWRVMPGELEALINRNEGPKIVCVIADWTMSWALEVAERLGLRRAVFCPAAAATLAMTFSIPKLVSDGIIDENGQVLTKQMIQLSPSLPSTTNSLWATIGNEATQKSIFNMLAKFNPSIKPTDLILCNSSNILEAAAFSFLPQFKPIGPLLALHKSSAGSFWRQDTGCLAWLDRQLPNSVVYVAFGSLAQLDSTQFLELALGLELSNRPFLWVVRRDMAAALPAGFEERVTGRVVEWAPQQEVLSHPSVACFISHCGWNSTLESIGSGVPMLCWPYFADQFCNRDYICDEWKIGLGLEKDQNGIVTREEVRMKVEVVGGGEGFKERVLNLGERVLESVGNGGASTFNFINFVDWIKNMV